MGTFHLTYNPYRVKTTLSVLNGTEWIDIGKESKLNWIDNRRMQFWLQAHEDMAWLGFFAELQEVSGDNELKVMFSGTEEDMADFERAALQCTDQDRLVVSVVPFCGEKQRFLSSTWKLAALQTKAEQAQRKGFFGVFSEELQNLIKSFQLSTKTKIKVVDLEQNNFTCDALLQKTAWDMGLFLFRYSQIGNTLLKRNVRNAFCRKEYLEELKRSNDRLLFVCICDSVELQHMDEIRKHCNDFFLESGISSHTLLFIDQKDRHNILHDITEGNYSRKFQTGNLLYDRIAVYRNRYAEQTRLFKLIERFFDMVQKENLSETAILRELSVSFGAEDKVYIANDSVEENPVGRLYDRLSAWNYKDEILGIKNSILLEFRKKFCSVEKDERYKGSFELEHAGTNKRYIIESGKNKYLHWLKGKLRGQLHTECECAVQVLDRKFVRICEEFIEEYESGTVNAEHVLSDWQIGTPVDLESPVNQVNENGFIGEIETISNPSYDSKIICITDVYESAKTKSLRAFEKWLKEYCGFLCEEMDGYLALVQSYLDDGNNVNYEAFQTDYREQLKEKSKIRQQAAEWLHDFLSEMEHLLDVD